MKKYDELIHLKDYLNFRIKSRMYEAKLASANKNVKGLCKMFLQDKFNKLDVVQKTRKEQDS